MADYPLNEEEKRLIEVGKRNPSIQGIYVGLKQIYPLGKKYEEVKVIPPKKIQGKMGE